MARILNFAAVLHEDVEIAVDGAVRWRLRDDVPTAILMRGMEIINLNERLQAADPHSAEWVDAAIAFDEAVLGVVAAIFRFTYNTMTRDEVQAETTPGQRLQIFNLFFLTRSTPSGAPSSATSSSSTEAAEPAEASPAAKSRARISPAATSKRNG